jgi:hypothetical protein
MNNEPKLPNRVKHIQGLYTKENSDLFIDDLTSDELRQIANHKEWVENYLYNKYCLESAYGWHGQG